MIDSIFSKKKFGLSGNGDKHSEGRLISINSRLVYTQVEDQSGIRSKTQYKNFKKN